MSNSATSRDYTKNVDDTSNFDYAALGNAYRISKEQVVYASGMTPTVMSTLALRFPQGLEKNTWDITKPRRNFDNTYPATIDMMLMCGRSVAGYKPPTKEVLDKYRNAQLGYDHGE